MQVLLCKSCYAIVECFLRLLNIIIIFYVIYIYYIYIMRVIKLGTKLCSNNKEGNPYNDKNSDKNHDKVVRVKYIASRLLVQ